MNVRALLSVLVMLGGVSAARTAGAVCMGAQEYRISSLGSALAIIPSNVQRRKCGDPDGLLRQNVTTGAVVKLPGLVAGTTTGYRAGEGFLDECVPPGKYRYGLAKPYVCCPTCCSTHYFVEVEVTSPPEPGCEAARIAGNAPPVPFTGQVPWGTDREICGYVAQPDAARPATTSRNDGGASPGTGGTPTTPPPGKATGGCSMGGSPETPVVLAVCGVLLAFGLGRSAGRRPNRPRGEPG